MKALTAVFTALAVAALPVWAQSDLDVPASEVPVADAQIIDASQTEPEDWLWLRRPVLVFADSANDPRYIQQMDYITERLDALMDRDVIVITDTAPGERSPFRQAMRPRGFMLAVLAKDGTVVTRKPSPWSVREITRSIDKLPLRQQEVRERTAAGS